MSIMRSMHSPPVQQETEGYQVRTPVYEGPLDLLLDLIEHAELDITTVALAMVTDQYLTYIKDMKIVAADEISSFLVIAAKLIQIKSEALLPQPPAREPGEENVGEALVQQLIRYKRFKEIAFWLDNRSEQGLRTYLRIAPPPKIEARLDLSDITLEDLFHAAEAIFAQEQEKSSLGTVIAAPKVTIREKIVLMAKMMKGKQSITFSEIIGESRTRLEIVVSFLALLELVKRYRVATWQEDLFSEIRIDPLEEWSEDEEFEVEFE